MIGCGGRGLWIGAHFVEHTGARFVAAADAFRDRAEAFQQKFKVDASRVHVGLDSYRELAGSRLDAVVIESPPYYHPEQVRAAVDASKHVFVAKPLAVDVPGCLSIRESGDRAKGKLSFLVDFQTRVRPAFQEAAARIHRGEIGAAVLGHVFYHAGRLRPRHRPGAPEEENRLRNWVFDIALSGDIIVEQNIHVIDTANWYLQSHPTQAFGTGGRKARVDYGDCWDHFLVQFWYPNDVRVDFSSAQFTRGWDDLCIRIHGSRGTADTHYGGLVRISGDNAWNGTEKDDTFTGGAVTNVKNFIESVRTGQYLNNVAESVDSNLTAILGRIAAYRQRVVTWDEMIRASERLEANLKL